MTSMLNSIKKKKEVECRVCDPHTSEHELLTIGLGIGGHGTGERRKEKRETAMNVKRARHFHRRRHFVLRSKEEFASR